MVDDLALAILFWSEVMSVWWRFPRDRSGETEILGQLRIPGGWRFIVLGSPGMGR